MNKKERTQLIEKAIEKDDISMLKDISWFYEISSNKIYGELVISNRCPNIRTYVIDHMLYKFSFMQMVKILDNVNGTKELIHKFLKTVPEKDFDNLVIELINKDIKYLDFLDGVDIRLNELFDRLVSTNNQRMYRLHGFINQKIKMDYPKLFNDIISFSLNASKALSSFLYSFNYYDYGLITHLKIIKEPKLNIAIIKSVSTCLDLASFNDIEEHLMTMLSADIKDKYSCYKLLTGESNMDYLLTMMANHQDKMTLNDFELII